MPRISPLDPNSDDGKAAAEALTAFLASVEPAIRRRRRDREASEVAADVVAGGAND